MSGPFLFRAAGIEVLEHSKVCGSLIILCYVLGAQTLGIWLWTKVIIRICSKSLGASNES